MMVDEQTGTCMFLTQQIESGMPRNTSDLSETTRKQWNRLQFDMRHQKDEVDWLLGSTVSSYIDTEENHVSHYFPSYCST
jgi:hypothetical protein